MSAMNRREFVGSGLALGLYSTGSEMVSPFLGAENLQPDPRPLPAPSWLSDGPIIMAGCWDDFPLFQKRVGGGPVWFDEAYKTQSAPQTIQALKDAGITLAVRPSASILKMLARWRVRSSKTGFALACT